MRSHAAKSPARDPTATLTPEDHTKDDKPAAAALTAHGRHFFVPGHMEAKIEMKITGNAMPMPQSVRSPTPLRPAHLPCAFCRYPASRVPKSHRT